MSKHLITLGLGLAVSALLWAGCSDDTVRGSLEPSPYHDAPVTKYFPVAEGYSTQLSVTSPDGGQSTVTYEIGDQTTYNYYEAYPLRLYKGTTLLSTDYLVVTDSALFLFEGGVSAQKILDLPLQAGYSWQRDDLTELNALDDQSDGGGGGDGGGDTGDDGGGATQSPQGYPATSGTLQMTVITKESVILDNDLSFSGVYRIQNENASGGYNYYWYASGVGLVKYVINANPSDINDGSEVGVLTDYGIGLRK